MRSACGQRWFSVSSVSRETSINQQLGRVIAGIPDDPALMILLLAPDVAHQRALDTMVFHLPDTPLIGCTTAGLVDRAANVGDAGQLIALGGPGFSASASIEAYERDGCRTAGHDMAEAVIRSSRCRGQEAFLLLSDGLRGDAAEVIRGAYGVGGASIPIAGGCAGDNMKMSETLQFANGVATAGSVAGAHIRSSGPIGIGVSHGWTQLGEPMVVTGTNGTTITTLNDRPALEVYLETVGENIYFHDSASFSRFALTRPLGLSDQVGHIRFVTGSDLSTGSLEFLVRIPEGQLVSVMDGTRESVVEAARSAAEHALADLGEPPLGVIAFDCVARRSVIGSDHLIDEMNALSSALPPSTPVAGFYSYGEIARTGGALGLHHQTMVVLALG